MDKAGGGWPRQIDYRWISLFPCIRGEALALLGANMDFLHAKGRKQFILYSTPQRIGGGFRQGEHGSSRVVEISNGTAMGVQGAVCHISV